MLNSKAHRQDAKDTKGKKYPDLLSASIVGGLYRMKKDDASHYHPRRLEKDMPLHAGQLSVIQSQQFLTLALCKDNEPYLVTLNYAFSESERCFYVHCATEGKKLEILRTNPRVWGQILDDRGYMQGKCSHAYRTVMFEGTVEFVQEPDAKLRALEMLINRFETNPEPLKAKLLLKAKIENTAVLRLRVLAMSGKQSPPPTSK